MVRHTMTKWSPRDCLKQRDWQLESQDGWNERRTSSRLSVNQSTDASVGQLFLTTRPRTATRSMTLDMSKLIHQMRWLCPGRTEHIRLPAHQEYRPSYRDHPGSEITSAGEKAWLRETRSLVLRRSAAIKASRLHPLWPDADLLEGDANDHLGKGLSADVSPPRNRIPCRR